MYSVVMSVLKNHKQFFNNYYERIHYHGKIYILMLHPEETRVVLKSKSHIEEYEYETKIA